VGLGGSERREAVAAAVAGVADVAHGGARALGDREHASPRGVGRRPTQDGAELGEDPLGRGDEDLRAHASGVRNPRVLCNRGGGAAGESGIFAAW
jgi:hypothetical protein